MSTPPDNYFTKEELGIIEKSMVLFSSKRHGFARAIARKGYTMRDGSIPSKADVTIAFKATKHCDLILHKINSMIERENNE